MRLKLIVLVVLISGCSHKWCIKKYPPEISNDTTMTVLKEEVPVVIPGGTYSISVSIDCDTIPDDTLTIYKRIVIPAETIWVTKIDTVVKIREGRKEIIKQKNPVNKILIGIIIGLVFVIIISLFFVLKPFT